MDQIQNSSPFNNNSHPPSASTSSASANQARQLHNQQRLLVQQQQQQLYNLLPGPSQLQTSPTSYSPSNTLPPIPTPSAQQQQQYFSSEGLSSPTRTTPPNSATWPLQRTSNSREELHPRQQQQYLAQQQARAQHQQQEAQAQAQAQSHPPIKREPMSYSAKDDKSAVASSSGSNGAPARGTEDPMPSTSDFVKKLYKMLEDPSFQSVVCWGPLGDCFVVKDMNEFTKSILPRMFKHSNFASFVRQLNKYDFHKVKNTDDNQFGEHSWTFRHPDFHADRRDALENIKRKVPAARKPSALSSSSALPPHSAGHPYANGRRSSSPPSLHPTAYPGVHPGHPHYNATTAQLTSEIQRLKEEGDDLRGRIRNLERNYESVLVEMVGFQRGMAQQDGLMQSLIAYFLGSESGKLKASANNNGASGSQLSPSTSRLQQAPGSSQPTPQQQLQAQIHSQLQQSQHAQAALQAQLSAVRERRASIEAAEGAAQPHHQAQQTQQAQQQSQGGSLAGALGGLGQISDQNPFLPPQTVQRILSGAPAGGLGNNLDPGGGGQGGGRMTPDILGRATLLQMSELSRRAAYLNAQGVQPGQGAEGGGRLWAGMNFPPGGGGEASASGGQGPVQPQGPDGQKLTRAEALAQIRDLHRERLSQGGWANAPAPSVPLGLGGVGAVGGVGGVGLGGVPISGQQRLGGQRRSMSEERERMAYAQQQQQQQGQPGQGGEMMQVDPQEAEDDRGRRAHRRHSEGGLRASSSGLSLAGEGGTVSQSQSPEEYVMPSPPPNSGAGTVSGSPQQVPQAQQQRQQSGTPNPWASLMNMNLNFANASGSGGPGGPFIVDSQPYNPSGSSSGGGPGPGFGMDDESNGLTHEGLQVYTVGHLLPRGVGMGGAEDARGSWSFDASGLAAGGMLGSMEGGNQGGEQQQYASGSYAGDDGEEEVVRPTPSNALVSGSSSHSMAEASSAAPPSSSSGAGKKLRVRRSTFVPGWAVPPRVLLVDDDAVSRKLSSKFLKVFGCTIDVAVDGIGAVNKMNLEKYDLVLMDIVMPKLDGVSATNLIRKFDQGTPIISMTSNSKPNEIMTYYSSGMNDILPKPFTKEGLLDMLEKHLMHLKVIQQLSKVPRSIGVPPLSDANFEQALTTSANTYMQQQQQGQSSNLIEGPSGSSSSDPNAGGVVAAPSPFNFNFNFGDGDDDGRINPLAGMGLTDEQYNMILQNIVNGDGFMGIPDDIASGGNPSGSGLVEVPVGVGVGGSEKRPLDDPSEDGRDGKRGRFEVIE